MARVRAILALGSVLMLGCGGGDSGGTTPWVGTWRLSSTDCTGVSLIVTGIAKTTLILGASKGTTEIQFTNGCVARMEDYIITPVSGGRFEFPTSTSERVVCAPNPCTGESTTTINGVVAQTETTACPDDLPPVASGLSPGSVNGSFLEATIDLGQGVSCRYRYAKVGD